MLVFVFFFFLLSFSRAALLGLGSDNGFGCAVTESDNGTVACSYCNRFIRIQPLGAQMLGSTSQAFVYGAGPCCNTDYNAYMLYDFATSGVQRPYTLPFSGWMVSAALNATHYYAVINSHGNDWVVLRLDPSAPGNSTTLMKFSSTATFGYQQQPGMGFAGDTIVLYGQGFDFVNVVLIDMNSWTVSQSVKTSIKYLRHAHVVNGVMAGIEVNEPSGIEGTQKFVTIDPFHPSAPKSSVFFCDESSDDCDWSGCALSPDASTFVCHGAVSKNCPNGNYGYATWTVGVSTGKISKSETFCSPPVTYKFPMFASDSISPPLGGQGCDDPRQSRDPDNKKLK
jgi:hypothetical protein